MEEDTTGDSQQQIKRPSFQFYPSDWLTHLGLRMCSVGARGLWIDMMCIMHKGSPYGHLKVKDKVIAEGDLARMVGGEVGEVMGWVMELETNSVLARTPDGIMYSTRMVEDERLRSIRAAGGKLGGNPALAAHYNEPGFLYVAQRASDGAIKIGISKEPSKRMYKIRTQHPGVRIEMLAKLKVEDMGAEEAALHALFGSKKDGDWFRLDDGELATLMNVHLKVNAKVKDKVIAKATQNLSSTPSSSSSSSSSLLNSVSYETGAVAPAPIASSVDNSGETLVPSPDERWGNSPAPPPPLEDHEFPPPDDFPRDESHGLSDEELSRLRTGTPPPMATPAEQRAAGDRVFVPPPGPWGDMETEIWAVGKALMAHYPPAAGPRGGRKDPGQMIGRWLREARDRAIVRDAIWAAIEARTQDPLSFIQKIVSEANHGRGRRQYQGDLRGVDYSHNEGFGIQEDWSDQQRRAP